MTTQFGKTKVGKEESNDAKKLIKTWYIDVVNIIN